MLHAAIVGLGRWGQILVNAVQEAGRPKGAAIRFTHAVVRTPEKAADFLSAQGLQAVEALPAVLQDPGIGAIVLATPHSQHCAQIVAAAAAGKHVFVEKPLTLTKASAEQAVAAAEAAQVILALGHNRRFLPAMRDLKTLIENGDLGRVLHIEGNFTNPTGYTYKPGMWRALAEECPAGGMTGLGIHLVDAMIHLCGPLAAVQAQSLRQVLEGEIDDTTSMLFRFEAGMTGTLSTILAAPAFWRLQVFGSKGWAQMRGLRALEVCTVGGEVETRDYPDVDIERAELEAFAAAVAGEVPYPLSGFEAIAGVAALESIVDSARKDAELVTVSGRNRTSAD